MASEEITICTIISRNYLAHARTLTDSFLKYNSRGKVFVLLVDEVGELFDPNKEKFTLVNLNEIGIDNLESFCFKYTILEQNTGAKAHFLKYLFEKYNLKKLAYFDPDILFSNSLENLWELLDKKSIVLTPHITAPIKDEKKPSELDFLRSGSYNLGFIALANTKNSQDFLDWWMPHLMEHSHADVSIGLFNDQKWMDMVPSLFNDVFLIKHPGYNVAYWNLLQRQIKIVDDKIEVNGKPLYFFHFSGFNPENIENVSKHQNRFSLKDLESVRPLFELYRDLLVENGYLETSLWKCKFNYFDNGVRIPDQARKIYFDSIEMGMNFGNPFTTEKNDPFIEYLKENIDKKQPIVTRLWNQVYKDRSDLKEAFPDHLGKDRESFVNWIQNSLVNESNIDRIFLNSYNQKKSYQLKESEVSHVNLVENEKTNKFHSKSGVNIAGYFQGEFGVAEAGRNFARAMKAVGIPHVLNNITASVHRNNDKTFDNFSKENPYPMNLVAVNADQSDVFYEQVGKNYFKNKFNIALWFWEISNFPEKWLNSLKYYDEIWVASNFVALSISLAYFSLSVASFSSSTFCAVFSFVALSSSLAYFSLSVASFSSLF